MSLATHSHSNSALCVAGNPCRWLVVLMWRLWHNGRSRIQIHTTLQNPVTVVFLAPHTAEGYTAVPVWVIPPCGTFKAEHCHAIRKHMAELCGNAAFRERHGCLLFADTESDARRSCWMQAALYVEGASTVSWMPNIPHIPF